ncbi:hypothetical protein AALO_G00094170, partial [Alosa alosa]
MTIDHQLTGCTQTEYFMKSMSIDTSTSDTPWAWGPATSTAIKPVHPRPARRPRVDQEEEEDESDISTITPDGSTYGPAQSKSNVIKSSQPTNVFCVLSL